MKILSFPHPQIMNLFLQLNTKEDILKNVGNQIFDGNTSIVFVFHTMEVNGAHQLFCNPYSKYLVLLLV